MEVQVLSRTQWETPVDKVKHLVSGGFLWLQSAAPLRKLGLPARDTATGMTDTGMTELDTLEETITDLRVGPAHCAANVMVMNPTTWSKVRRTKDSQGRYLAGDPLEQDLSNLWGIPVVTTTTMAAGSALVADVEQLALVYQRMGVTIETDPGADGFERNLTRIRGEERFALTCPRPQAGILVTNL